MQSVFVADSSDKNSFYFLPENSKRLRIFQSVEKNKTKKTQRSDQVEGLIELDLIFTSVSATRDDFDFSFYD